MTDAQTTAAGTESGRTHPVTLFTGQWADLTLEEVAKHAAGTDEWRIVPELDPASSEPLVPKHYPDAFEETELEAVLADLGTGRIVVTGSQTDECIRSTIHGGLTRGYDVTLVGDAHTTEDLSPWGAPSPELVIAHTNLYWANHRAPGRRAEVVDASDVRFG